MEGNACYINFRSCQTHLELKVQGILESSHIQLISGFNIIFVNIVSHQGYLMPFWSGKSPCPDFP